MKKFSDILIGLLVLALVDTLIPFPITAVILLYVIWQKPGWFKDMVSRVYGK